MEGIRRKGFARQKERAKLENCVKYKKKEGKQETKTDKGQNI